jgi:putative tryptophan/tyrosine transport system substrate-binding protein
VPMFEIRRREFITLLGGAAVGWPWTAHAQQPQPARVGLLAFGQGLASPLFGAFRDEMRKLGHVEGRSYVLEFRSARGDPDGLQSAAGELAQIPVDVIVTDSGAASIAAKKATGSVPIVMGVISDPVELGLVASMARPGGNITGFSIISPQLGTKRLALLKEAVAATKVVGILMNPASPVTSAQQLAPIRDAAALIDIALVVGEARNADTIPGAIEQLVARRISALMVIADGVFFNHRRLIVERAAANRLPGMYPEREYAEAGGLLAYGPSVPDNFRRAAGYVARILRGEKAGDLPIEQPAKFELVINLKTAKAIGTAIPPTLPLLADEVIE